MTLFHRLLLLIFGVGLTPIIPTGILLFYYQSVAKTNTLDLHANVSQMAATTIKQSMANLNNRLAFAELFEEYSRKGEKNRAEALIKETMAANPDFLLVAVLDPKGRELFKVGTAEMLRRYGVLERSHDPVFIRSKQTGKVVFSDFDSMLGIPVGTLVFPLKDDRHIFMIVSFAELWSRLQQQKIGKTGRIFLADAQGRLFRFAGDSPPVVSPDFLREMFSGEYERSDFIPARNGVFVGAFKQVPDFNLFVVTMQLRNEAFWVIRLTTSLIIFFLLAVATASYFAALAASRRLIGPIMELVEGARRVGAKDFGVPVNEKTNLGEFAVLLKSFNGMMAEVKKYHGMQLDQILQEKEKVDLLIKLMNDGIILTDLKGEVVYANRTALDAIGFSREPEEGFRIPDSVRKGGMRKSVHDIIRKSRMSETIEIDRDGEHRFFKVSVQVFSAGAGEPGMFIVMRDVTLEHEIDVMKDDFFHSVAHDLRAPLLGMQGYMKLLKHSCSKMPKEMEYISALQRSGDKLFVLIQDILDMARMEAGQLKLKAGPIDPGEFLGRVFETFIPVSSEKDIKLELKLPQGRIKPFQGDERLLERVMQNLLSNAVKFTPRGGRVVVEYAAPTLPSSQRGEGAYVEISVSDTGPGVPPDKAHLIFDKFMRSSESEPSVEPRQAEGFGLGLAICKKIAELHSGSVRVEPVQPKGSKFVFRIPRLAGAGGIVKPLPVIIE